VDSPRCRWRRQLSERTSCAKENGSTDAKAFRRNEGIQRSSKCVTWCSIIIMSQFCLLSPATKEAARKLTTVYWTVWTPQLVLRYSHFLLGTPSNWSWKITCNSKGSCCATINTASTLLITWETVQTFNTTNKFLYQFAWFHLTLYNLIENQCKLTFY